MKCAMCQTEIRGGAKKCPLCGSKVDFSAEIEAKKEQEKAYAPAKTQKKTNWRPPTPEEQEKARERERQRAEESARMQNYSTSKKGMIIAIIGTIAMVFIQFLTFKFSTKDYSSYTWDNLCHDINNYRYWFGGLIVGTILISIASYLLIKCLTNRFYNEQTIFGVILCVISIMLIVLSLSKIEDRKKNYDNAKELYDIEVDRQSRDTDRRNRDIADVQDMIDRELYG